MMSLRALIPVALTAALACNEPGPRAGSTAVASPTTATLGLKDLRPLDVVSGTIRIPVEGPVTSEKLELLADGKPVASLGGDRSFSLDTTRLPDGLVTISLAGGAGRKISLTPVIVINRGSEAFFKNGSSGTVSVPPVGERPHQHLRYHFDLPEGVKRVLAVLTWSSPGFELELALGQGTCPHHGVAHAKTTGTSSPLSVVHAAPEGSALAAGQWFAHVDVKNPQQVAGKDAPFSVKAFLLR